MLLDILEKEINNLGIYEGKYTPEIVKAIVESIPSNISTKIKQALAISEIITFISQFRINIRHWNESIIPINAITFCIAQSGAAKDSSLKAARACFKQGYNIINKYRNDSAVKRAIELARESGYEFPEKFASYKDFYIAPNPLFVNIGTSEGFIQHLNDLSNDEIGSGFITSSEIGSDLNSDPNLQVILKNISELYDMGCKEIKVIKNRETQSKEINSFPVSAAFLGSGDNIIFDEQTKKKFKLEFNTKLARRSFFVYSYEDIIEDNFTSIKDMLAEERRIQDNALQVRKEVSVYIEDLTNQLLNRSNTLIKVDDKTRDLFELYKKYNEALADTIDIRYPISKLTRYHLQWKALKLAGALALIQDCETIDAESYLAAMEYNEYIYNDILMFEKDLLKEPYELFVDFAHKNAINNTYRMSLHDLRKAGFISNKGLTTTQLTELVKLANSYDYHGTYKCEKDIVEYNAIIKKDTILVSYLECTGTKQERAKKCTTGYVTEEMYFSDLMEMLKGDYAYSPFKFLNGTRGKDNIDSGCKWLVLDIDTSEITDEECHFLLSGLNHFIVRTSNKDNPNKYRVLLELDSEVNIPPLQWKVFLTSIIEDLGLVADILPKAQIYFSYRDRNILYELDGEPLETKPYLDAISNIDLKSNKIPSKKICNEYLNDPITTFQKAFDAKQGEGSRKLIWAIRYARELGADLNYCLELLDQISSYWVKPFPEDRLEAMKQQISRWSW